MMRRVTWLAAGAVLGVMGYRRFDRATRALAGQFGSLPAKPLPASPPPASSAPVRLSAAAAGWLIRQARARKARTRQLAASGAGVSPHGVSAFVSDVRAGMAEYLDRHRATGHRANLNRQYPIAGNTLVGQRAQDRTAIPGSALGRTLGETSGNTSDKTKDGR